MKQILIGLLLLPLLLSGSIVTTNEVKPYLDLAGAKSVVILDIADTLIEFKDVVLHKEYDSWKNEYYGQILPNANFDQTWRYIQIVEEVPTNWQLVNPNWPMWIQELKDRGVTVIGLTKTLLSPPLQKSLSNTLETFGITFSQDLIATSSSLKDQEVVKLAQSLNPSLIIFVDDREEQVVSVNKALSNLNVPNYSIHFNTPHYAPPLNEAKAKRQLELLVNEHIWVNDNSSRLLGYSD